jgi:predicted HAD superfamily Cof-like phosphohydrolase
MVLEFHETFALPVAPGPTLDVSAELVELRRDLLNEELKELTAALDNRDLIGVADALGDIAYVIYGTALTFGIDLDAVVTEIHRANMSKLGRNAKPVLRSDGKVLKGPDYRPPAIAAVLGRKACAN